MEAGEGNSAVAIIQAVAMPAAIIVCSVTILIIVIILSRKGSKLRLKVRDWVEVGSDGQTEKVGVQSNEDDMAVIAQREVEKIIDEEPGEVAKSSVDADEVSSPLMALVDAANSEDLEVAYNACRDDPSSIVRADEEFWTTYYVQRKAKFENADENVRLIELHEQHAEWAHPIAIIIGHLVNQGQFGKAESWLSIGLKNKRSSGYPRVLSAGINLRDQSGGYEKVLEFFWSMIGDLDDAHAASLISAVVDVREERQKSIGLNLLREVEISLDPTRSGSLWKLAYQYGERKSTELISYRRYREMLMKDKSVSASLNNMGVIAAEFSDNLGIFHQEEAIEKGDDFSVGNIANRLIAAGFLERAGSLLDRYRDNNTTPTILKARSELQMALTAQQKKLEELRDLAYSTGTKVRSAAVEAYNVVLQRKNLTSSIYSSDSGEILIDDRGAQLKVKIAGKQYEGRLQPFLLGYEGGITDNGSGAAAAALLLSSHHAVVLRSESERELNLMIFNDDNRLKTIVVEKLAANAVETAPDETS